MSTLCNQFIATLAAKMQSDILDQCVKIDYITYSQIDYIDKLDNLITSLGFSVEDFKNSRQVDLGSFHGRMIFWT